jgi:glycosyltransferase involved in cell wall biosynthesis
VRRLLYLSPDPGVPVLGYKGASVHVRGMVSAFARAGVKVIVASPRVRAEGDVLEAAAELVEIDPVLPSAQTDSRTLRARITAQSAQIEEVARGWGVDAIYERYALFSEGGVRTASRFGLPHVLEVNAPLREEAKRFRSLPHPEAASEVEAGVLSATGRVIAVSDPLARWLVSAGVEPERITVTPNAIDPAHFPARLRSREGPLVVGFAGSLKPWHGIDVLVEAFLEARTKARELRLEIVGTGPGLAAVVAAASAVPSIVSHGSLSHRQTVAVMSRWDVGAAPYLPLDGFYFSPLKLVEYMAAGLCPVASDVGEIAGVLDDGSRGLLVPAGDPRALSGAFVDLACDRARAHEIGCRARDWALTERSWDTNAQQALGILADLEPACVA